MLYCGIILWVSSTDVLVCAPCARARCRPTCNMPVCPLKFGAQWKCKSHNG